MAFIKLYCPLMGKPHKTREQSIVPNKILELSRLCQNPLGGQQVTLSEIPVRPQLHFPNSPLGNKQMSGYSANLFLYFAKYFRFMPSFIITGTGVSIPYNNTFSPGKFNDVQ